MKSVFTERHGSSGGRGRRNTQERSLYIDPRNEIQGHRVLNLPEVWHHSENYYLHFYYEMAQGGLHAVTVRARCSAGVTNNIVQLSENDEEYEITNYHKEDKSGWCCIDVHHYLHQDECESFTIQLIAFAAHTSLLVDNIFFSSGISWRCGGKNGEACFGMICALHYLLLF
jgi:hypothetical protein